MWQLFLHLPDAYLIGVAIWLSLLAVVIRGLVQLRRRFKAQPGRLRAVHLGLSLWLMSGLLTGIELGFALLYDTTDSFDMTNVSHRWFEVHVQPDLKPLEFRDGTGIEYRDDVTFPAATARDRRHLCFLGDSFTFGQGVPRVGDRFTNRLGQQLEQDPATSGQFVVSNLSKPGSDLLWSDEVLKHLYADGRQLDAAAYVVCLNDIEAFHRRFMDFNHEVEDLRNKPSFFLWRDTYFFNWAYFRGVLLSRSDVRNYYDFVKDYYAGESWPRYLTALDRMAGRCRENSTRPCVVIFPFLHNLGPDYPFAAIHQQIADACRERDIVCVDLLPALSAQRHAGLTVNPFDAHPNERAHAIAADELLRLLVPVLAEKP